MYAANTFLSDRIGKLKHAYVISDLPVDKSLFLEPDLVISVRHLQENTLDAETIGEIRRIIWFVDDSHSDEYYWLFTATCWSWLHTIMMLIFWRIPMDICLQR